MIRAVSAVRVASPGPSGEGGKQRQTSCHKVTTFRSLPPTRRQEDLLQVGINVGGNAMAAWTRSGWPKSPRALAGRLRRAQTPLRALGIEIVFGREGRLGTRTIRITAMGENRTHNTVSTVSRVSDHGDRAGLNHPPPGLEQAL